MRIDEADHLVLTKSDGAVAVGAVGVVAGGTYLGLNTKTNTAAILAFAAAIFVALLTAYWTQRRLSQELGAAKARLALQLSSEDERHRDDLAFQRGETDRGEVRSILDSLAAHLFEMEDAAREARAAALFLVEDDDVADLADWQRERLRDWQRERLESRRDRLDSEAEAVVRDMQRLNLRLGKDGELLVRTATLMRVHATSVHMHTFRPNPESLEQVRADVDELHKLATRFTEHALPFTKAELHRSSADRATT